MTNGEGLPEERAVGVAVEIDLVDTERVEHEREVVGRERGAVEIGGRSELRAAESDAVDVVAGEPLQWRATNRLRRAGAAVVDEQEVAAVEQRVEQREVRGRARRRRVAGSALGRDDRSQRRERGVTARGARNRSSIVPAGCDHRTTGEGDRRR